MATTTCGDLTTTSIPSTSIIHLSQNIKTKVNNHDISKSSFKSYKSSRFDTTGTISTSIIGINSKTDRTTVLTDKSDTKSIKSYKSGKSQVSFNTVVLTNAETIFNASSSSTTSLASSSSLSQDLQYRYTYNNIS
eukprot:UN03324